MLKNIFYYLITPITILAIGITMLSSFFNNEKEQYSNDDKSEKINLALRQTAHILLKQAGDSTSMIAPIKKISDTRYWVQLEHNFNYDTLPIVLDKYFSSMGIDKSYDVSVWQCDNKELILGYSSINLLKGDDIACNGRNKDAKCLNFMVTFEDTPSVFYRYKSAFYLGLGLTLSFIGFIFYFLYFKKEKNALTPLSELKENEAHLIHVGNTVFDNKSQTIRTNNEIQKLTFREAKLLHLFCENKNELLDRDYILKQVWEDEGVLVGRSVDVFVSRLRKLLKNDTRLKITNVHSRGYKFEEIAPEV